MSFLMVIVGILIIVFALKFNLWLGVAVLAALLAYLVYSNIPAFYTAKGNRAYQAGDEETAREWYKKAYDTGKTNVKFKTSYAYLLLRTGRADEAEAVLDPIIRVKALDAAKKNMAKQQRCMVYYKQGRIDEAIEEAMELYNEGYKTTNLYGMLGFFMLLTDKPLDETLEMCEEAYDFNKEDRDILDNLSLCYYKLGRYEDAEKISDELLENYDEFVEGYYHGAQIALKLGKKEKAAEYAAKLDGCKRSSMTTVTEEEVEKLKQEVSK